MRWLAVGATVLGMASAQVALGQSTRSSDLGAGKLLVASRDLGDPNFAKTVVLLVQYDQDGVVGLIINRRSQVMVSRLLDKMAGTKGRSEGVYAGGPVEQNAVLALLRSRKPPVDARHVLGDVFLVSSKTALEQTFSIATESDKVHVYVGYSGWTEPQLENELNLGAWFIFPGSATSVFDSDPDSLWARLIRETEVQVARAR